MQIWEPGANARRLIYSLPLVKFLVISALFGSVLLSAADRDMSVVTLNMAKETGVDRILRELSATPALRDADLLLLQEVKQDSGQRQCVAEQLAAKLGRYVVYSPAETGITDQGLAILSRYPLRDVRVRPLRRYNLGYRSRSRIALSATAESPWGSVRVVNTHLDTRLNAQERLEQLEPVIRDTDEFAGARIIGGDFNSNFFRWIGNMFPAPSFRSQAYAVQDFMIHHGFRTGLSMGRTTFDYLGLQLDWIWLRGLQPHDSRVYPLDFSDHHAVWTRVEFPRS